MSLICEQRENILVLTVVGQFDSTGINEMRNEVLRRTSGLTKATVVYDISHITAFDSNIISALHRAKLFSHQINSVIVVGGQGYTKMAFQIAAKLASFRGICFTANLQEAKLPFVTPMSQAKLLLAALPA